MRKLIVGNWKMNLTRQGAVALAASLGRRAGGNDAQIVLCPPAIWLCDVAETIKNSNLLLGAQDVSPRDEGAFTGDISAPMLKEAGVSHVILGHSERRAHHAETGPQIRAKAEACLRHGLMPVICVGEDAAQRESGEQERVVAAQLADSLPENGDFILAYEPVWAIGTGKTATAADILAMHGFIRAELAKRVDRADQVVILYGGSVKAANASEILATRNVDGVLVGGASLQADEFLAIVDRA